MLAPDPFWWRFPSLWRYVPANLTPDADYDWIVVHKGELPAIPRPFLEHVVATTTPVLANEVFVVFAADPREPPVPVASPHLLSFLTTLAQLPPVPDASWWPSATACSRRRRRCAGSVRWCRPRPERSRTSSSATAATATRPVATRRTTRRCAGTATSALRPGTRVLDVASGAFPAAPLPADVTLVRTDFSPVGVAQAVTLDVDEPGVHHLVCDAAALAVPSAAFDIVLFVDSIEHVFDAEAVLVECARALRPGGELLVTFSNTNSLNQILTRALGHPTFVTNHQHVREFTPAEIFAMLDTCGFDVVETGGIELRPYWGVPGIDHVLREVIDEDPELVAALAELGRRAGIDYAYVGVVTARERA